MEIKNPEFIYIDRYPFLRFDLDGKEALIGQCKKSLLDLGYVILSSRSKDIDWNKILPPIDLPASENRGRVYLTGAVSDPTIVKLAQRLWEASNSNGPDGFKEGPIEI